jgi:hypothetical protein
LLSFIVDEVSQKDQTKNSLETVITLLNAILFPFHGREIVQSALIWVPDEAQIVRASVEAAVAVESSRTETIATVMSQQFPSLCAELFKERLSLLDSLIVLHVLSVHLFRSSSIRTKNGNQSTNPSLPHDKDDSTGRNQNESMKLWDER